MLDQVRAILWAQWRTLWNFYPRGHMGSLAFTVIMSTMWYGMVLMGGVGVGILLSEPERLPMIERLLPRGLMMAFLYWQVVPIILVSTGASLDLKRLRVYPVSHRELFLLEVLLRLTTGVEMIVILICATIGMEFNHALPWWAPLGFVPFVLVNLCLAAGLRGLLGRILARRGVREFAVFLFVVAMALPQLLLAVGLPASVRGMVAWVQFRWWPWILSGQIAAGKSTGAAWGLLMAWTAATLLFGRWQFERGLRFDEEAAQASPDRPTRRFAPLEWLYRLPSRLLPDPLGVLVEKEVRSLARSPRFRLVFLMGFSFGLLIWLPLAYRSGPGEENVFTSNYLTFVTLYALMLLGEVSFWNTFGFDRSAAQIYYLIPVRLSLVLAGKNIAAVVFVLLEITAVAAVCGLLRMPLSPQRLLESYAVTLVMTLYLMSVGNLGSTHYPRPVNPAQSWRTASAGRFQALLLLVYPIVAIPIVLAYLARYAFDSEWAFVGVLGFATVLGGVVYWISMESSVQALERNREKILTTLGQGEGPVTA